MPRSSNEVFTWRGRWYGAGGMGWVGGREERRGVPHTGEGQDEEPLHLDGNSRCLGLRRGCFPSTNLVRCPTVDGLGMRCMHKGLFSHNLSCASEIWARVLATNHREDVMELATMAPNRSRAPELGMGNSAAAPLRISSRGLDVLRERRVRSAMGTSAAPHTAVAPRKSAVRHSSVAAAAPARTNATPTGRRMPSHSS